MRVVLVEPGTREILHSQKVPTPADPREGVSQLTQLWKSVGEPRHFGFASAAELQDGRVTRWPSRPEYVGSDLRAAFDSARPLCTDDASAAAYGEYTRTSQSNGGSGVYITVGTGVGGGAVLAGKLWQGHHGIAMDIGHVQVPAAAGVSCSCGASGCVQAIASGRALQREDGATHESRLALASRGLGELLLLLQRILDCPVFILGGGVLHAEPSLLDSIARNACRLGVTGELVRGVLGSYAGAVGVAELAYESGRTTC
jgi:predicted NBD/HSP70 family sugar kinase